jgi:hypothetical protein
MGNETEDNFGTKMETIATKAKPILQVLIKSSLIIYY